MVRLINNDQVSVRYKAAAEATPTIYNRPVYDSFRAERHPLPSSAQGSLTPRISDDANPPIERVTLRPRPDEKFHAHAEHIASAEPIGDALQSEQYQAPKVVGKRTHADVIDVRVAEDTNAGGGSSIVYVPAVEQCSSSAA